MHDNINTNPELPNPTKRNKFTFELDIKNNIKILKNRIKKMDVNIIYKIKFLTII